MLVYAIIPTLIDTMYFWVGISFYLYTLQLRLRLEESFCNHLYNVFLPKYNEYDNKFSTIRFYIKLSKRKV